VLHHKPDQEPVVPDVVGFDDHLGSMLWKIFNKKKLSKILLTFSKF
jgi:hypothetical protein